MRIHACTLNQSNELYTCTHTHSLSLSLSLCHTRVWVCGVCVYACAVRARVCVVSEYACAVRAYERACVCVCVCVCLYVCVRVCVSVCLSVSVYASSHVLGCLCARARAKVNKYITLFWKRFRPVLSGEVTYSSTLNPPEKIPWGRSEGHSVQTSGPCQLYYTTH